jgi:hypothetical protein
VTLKCIYIRNPLSFNLSPKNRLIKGNLTFAIPMPLIFSLSILLLFYNRLTISYNCPLITIYKLVSVILISSLNLKVVAAVISVVTGAFGSILFDFFYYNPSSNYIIIPYRRYYNRCANRRGI